ncbi:MAG: hypothetical protein EBU35_14355 [Marivivens sp.]|nr:hypothetical protein [Marivivens sp.]
MKGVDFNVRGVDNNGYTKIMTPGNDYKFPNAKYVIETPIKNKTMNKDLKYMPIDDKAGTFMSKHCSPVSYGTPLEKKSCANYGTPLNQKMEPGNVGYYDSDFEEHPSMKLPTRPENKAEIEAAKFSGHIAEKKFKDLRNLFRQSEVVGDKDPVLSKQILRERESLAKEIHGLRKQKSDAEAKMRKQKRKDYQTILKAGETIGKSLKR